MWAGCALRMCWEFSSLFSLFFRMPSRRRGLFAHGESRGLSHGSSFTRWLEEGLMVSSNGTCWAKSPSWFLEWKCSKWPIDKIVSGMKLLARATLIPLTCHFDFTSLLLSRHWWVSGAVAHSYLLGWVWVWLCGAVSLWPALLGEATAGSLWLPERRGLSGPLPGQRCSPLWSQELL